MRVIHYQRKPAETQHSIERVFGEIRKAFPDWIECRVALCRYNRGILRRLYDTLSAVSRQGDVNHVTGDAHYLAILLRGRSTILTVHDCVNLHRLSGIKRALLKYFWYDLPVARCRAVVCISRAAAGELAALVPRAAGKIRVIPNPVSRDYRYSPAPSNTACPRILHLGSNPNKNLPRLAQALEGIPCHLEIVGRPAEDAIAVLRRCKIRHTATAGLTDGEVVRKYRDCDMVAFVSTYEGFGMPIVEANATGRPVVAGDIGSVREVAGDAACLVNPLDVGSIREGVLRVIGDGAFREELIRRGIENAKRFDAERIAAQYAALYRETGG